MNAGRLDTLVTPQSSTPTWSAGEATDSWVDGTAFWASVDEATGREQIRAGQIDSRQAVVVTARYSDTKALTPTDRLALPDGRILDIESIREIRRREGREFLCLLNSDGGA